MADVLGPTFGNEVIAAGLGGLNFAWGSDGSFTGRDNLTPEQNATLDGVIAAHDPATPLPPPPDQQLMFDHENRLRTIEGQPLLSFDEFVTTKLG